MVFRKAAASDANHIMEIIAQAQSALREQGVDQWQNGYPNSDVIRQDIEASNCYVLLRDDRVAATVTVSFDEEKTYEKIYQGAWLSNGAYAVIHRLAVGDADKRLGLASIIINQVTDMCHIRKVHSIRADTHADNKAMQQLLVKHQFAYCGIICLVDGNQRFSYEKEI